MFKAEKGIVGDFLTMFIWGMVVVFILVFMIVFKQVSDNNHMVDYSSQVVARYGGMTNQAKREIEEYSMTTFNGRYKVISEIQTARSYGQPLKFTLSSDIEVLYFKIPLNLKIGGTSTSRRR